MESTNISGLSSSIINNLDSPSGVSLPSVSGWVEINVGRLNLLLDQCFVTKSGLISPALGNTEALIMHNMYKTKYFENQAFKIANNVISDDAMDWTSLEEGDSSITRTNRSNLLQHYRKLKNDAERNIDILVDYYRSNRGGPIQTAGEELLFY